MLLLGNVTQLVASDTAFAALANDAWCCFQHTVERFQLEGSQKLCFSLYLKWLTPKKMIDIWYIHIWYVIIELYHDDCMYEYVSIVMTVMSFLISLIFVFSQDRVITWGSGFCDSSVVQDQLQGKGANPIIPHQAVKVTMHTHTIYQCHPVRCSTALCHKASLCRD